MSDDRFSPEEQPTNPQPCRRYVAPGKPDYVTADEIDAFIERLRKMPGPVHTPGDSDES